MAQLLLVATMMTPTTVMMTVTAVMMTVLICLSVVELAVLTVGHRPVFCHG
jgi:hypothetical protein